VSFRFAGGHEGHPEEAQIKTQKTQTVTHEAFCACTTRSPLDFVDITDDIQDAVSAAQVARGRATVFSPTDRCPIVMNERESGLLKDIRAAVGRIQDANGTGVPTTIGAKSVVIPIVDGRLRLGTWQRVLLFELDEPGERSVFVQIVGE
jgi:secondary thiamine-phosphate synthase enzyme